MKRKIIVLILGFLPFIALCQSSEEDVFRVFFLGGQSNMDGFGYVNDLPESLNKTFENVWIFHGNSARDDEDQGGIGIWEPLKPGHGVRFSSDGEVNNLSNRFGVELSFAEKIQELYSGDKIAIIKYSRGGTAIDTVAAGTAGSWDPDFRGKHGINQYDHFLQTVRNAYGSIDIDGNGKVDKLIPCGILWMQGEADAEKEETAHRYHKNLKRLMDLIRAVFRVDDLPVVIGKISDSWNNEEGKVWNYGEMVQAAQEKFAATDEKAAIVRDTRYYKYSDPWHYDSEGYIDLGKRFAEEVYQLSEGNR
jgi:hypothetical protein